MIEVHPSLFVGNGDDFDYLDDRPKLRADWFIISSAKEPWHRRAVGYTSRALPKDHPEYLIARRPSHLVLNLIDADDPAYIRPEIMAAAVECIGKVLPDGRKILVHCNRGRSRSPSIALWYMHKSNALPAEHDAAVNAFTTLYPEYAPARGMAEFIRQNW